MAAIWTVLKLNFLCKDRPFIDVFIDYTLAVIYSYFNDL